MRLLWLAAPVVIFLSNTQAGMAEEEGGFRNIEGLARDIADDLTFELGAGAMVGPDYEGSDDYDIAPVPVVEIAYKDRLRLTTKDGPGIFATPYRYEDFSVELGVRYEAGRDQDDNDALRGLGDLDVGAVAVGRLSYEFGPLEAGLEVARDLTGDRDGTAVTAELTYGVTLLEDRLHLGVAPHVTWASEDYMDNTFGISAAQSAASVRGLAQHNAGAGLKDAGLSLNLGYQITENITAFGGAQYSRLLGDAADSPLVDREGSANQFSSYLGVSYRW